MAFVAVALWLDDASQIASVSAISQNVIVKLCNLAAVVAAFMRGGITLAVAAAAARWNDGVGDDMTRERSP